mmetsp:Transcript_95502/g.187502  ORF Transcript_95502/g.187502 Transcript_95502/m.187502 type:complete len:138 (-) Transcript_95502:414-827(-)
MTHKAVAIKTMCMKMTIMNGIDSFTASPRLTSAGANSTMEFPKHPTISMAVTPKEYPAMLLLVTNSQICGMKPKPKRAVGTALPRMYDASSGSLENKSINAPQIAMNTLDNDIVQVANTKHGLLPEASPPSAWDFGR